MLGTAINDKTFILDIRISLNDNDVINLELQVINQHNWVERSLSYLCRAFDSLLIGDSYLEVKPVTQIGLLNFTLFPEHPEFYATYQLLNVKDYSLYSDKLRLSVLDLTRIDLATEEDRSCQLDCWARFFKATTWEELHMLAQNNETIVEAASTVYKLTQEERIRMECEAREDYYRTQRDMQLIMKRSTEKLEKLPPLPIHCGSLGICSATIRESAVQSYLPEQMRARVNAFFNVLFAVGRVAFQFLAGALGQFIPYRAVAVLLGGMGVGSVFLFIVLPAADNRPVYEAERS